MPVRSKTNQGNIKARLVSSFSHIITSSLENRKCICLRLSCALVYLSQKHAKGGRFKLHVVQRFHPTQLLGFRGQSYEYLGEYSKRKQVSESDSLKSNWDNLLFSEIQFSSLRNRHNTTSLFGFLYQMET